VGGLALRGILTFCILFSLLILGGCGSTAPVPPIVIHPVDTYFYLAGTVRLPNHGDPSDSIVTLMPGHIQTKLDKTGYFVFTSLPPNTYSIKVVKSGYAVAEKSSIDLSSASLTLPDMLLQTDNSGGSETGITVTSTGNVLIKLSSSVASPNWTDTQVWLNSELQSVKPDTRGLISLYGIPCKSYHIEIIHPNFRTSEDNFSLTKNATISKTYMMRTPSHTTLSSSVDFQAAGVYSGYFMIDQSISSYRALTESNPAFVGMFISFLYNGANQLPGAYSDDIQRIVDNGSIPFLTWEPWDATRPNISILPDILTGKYDRFIDNWASYLRGLDQPVYIRWGHEMQGNWYPWANNAEVYVTAFRYLVDRFRDQGATNVHWVFGPNHNDGGSGKNYMDYYPGNTYVDALCISGYNFGSSQSWSDWRSFSTIYSDMVADLNRKIGKPIFIDVASSDQNNQKAGWIGDMMNRITHDPAFSSIKVFVWFQTDKTGSGETDWRVNSSPASLSAYKAALNNPSVLSRPIVLKTAN